VTIDYCFAQVAMSSPESYGLLRQFQRCEARDHLRPAEAQYISLDPFDEAGSLAPSVSPSDPDWMSGNSEGRDSPNLCFYR
jgi:hypothetical protein